MNSTYMGKFSLALLASVSAAFTASPAYAQTSGVSLDEIVVTAQKREESLQEITLAVSAISADKIESLNIEGAQDISGLAPNVTIVGGTTSLGASVISIRGIPSPATETFGLDTANGFYIDGVYIARSAATGLDVLDVERVEILRGPQGTLFGRNTTGGAINFVSKRPSDQFGLKGEIGAGNFDAFNGRILINTGNIGREGEIAGLKTSFSYSHSQRDGVVDNLLESDSNDPGARNTDALRFATTLDFDDTTSLSYIGDWSRVEGRAQAFQLIAAADGTPRPPLDVNGQLVAQTQQAPVQQILAAGSFAQPECAALGAPQRSRRDTICLDADDDGRETTFGHNVTFEKDFGHVRLKSITAYREWESIVRSSDLSGLGTLEVPQFTADTLLNGGPEALLPFVGVPAAFAPFVANAPVPTTTQSLFDTSNDREHNQFSQEVEVAGDTDTLDWVVGGFYFTEEGGERNLQNSGFALDTNNIFLGNFGPIGPAFAAANPEQFRLVVTNGILEYQAEAESYALYGQFTYHPGGRDSRLNLTAGARYTWDEKSLKKIQDGTAPFAETQVGERKFNKLTWNLAAGYDLTDNINLYGRAATGYRSGGFNANDRPPAGSNDLPSFEEETLTSYEVGFKSELFDNRVRFNAAAYRNVYDDLAVVIPVSNAAIGTFGSRLANAGRVNYTGFELEGQALINSNLSIDGTLGYVDVDFDELLAGTPVNGTQAVDIASIAVAQYTSPLTANIAVNWEQSLNWKDSVFRARVGYTHEDGKYSFISSTAAPFNEQLLGDDVDIIDAQIGIYEINNGGSTAFVQLWGRNLTNSGDLVRGVDFGQLGYAGGYFADPRTYGVRIGFEY